MMGTMVKEKAMIKNTSRGIRMMKSAAARLRRKEKKEVIEERTENLYSRLRRLRRSKKDK